MAVVQQPDLSAYCHRLASQARNASVELVDILGQVKDQWLMLTAGQLRHCVDDVLAANQKDLARAPEFGLSAAQIDRLLLDRERVERIARGLEDVANQADPIGEVIGSSRHPNGLDVSRIRVPLGVIFFIYESRPNVTADAAALCVKSGNAVILRGGKEAYHSSRAIVDVLLKCAMEVGLPEHAVQLVDEPRRDAVDHFLKLGSLIDVAIPRGGEALIRRVTEQATMPVIKHFAGNCHVFVDRSASLDMAQRIVVDAKCQRPGVCNSCETLLIHRDVAAEYLPIIGQSLRAKGVELRACERSVSLLQGARPATEEDYRTEFLDLILAVKMVDDLEEAILHVNTFGSRHTDAIVTSELYASRRFASRVDSAAVMVNVSTRLNDGGQFGLGAEIGISTDKFHARGPCGLRELTTYKYVCHGDGLIREG